MRVALAQLIASTDPAANLNQVRAHIKRAVAAGAELLVLPEATMCSFSRPRADTAEPFDGPWATAVRAAAAAAGLTVVVGMFTTTGTDRIANTLLATGVVEARYDKLHLFDALGYAESRQIQPGTQPVHFDLAETRIGLATCYDVRFPQLFTHLAGTGAELILLPASWAPGEHKLHQWRTLVTARAMDATAFVVAVDQALCPAAADGRTPTGIGHSMVVDPTGNVLLELGDDPEFAVIDLNLAQVADVRRRLPVLEHTQRSS